MLPTEVPVGASVHPAVNNQEGVGATHIATSATISGKIMKIKEGF
jgi:hypothetical protein